MPRLRIRLTENPYLALRQAARRQWLSLSARLRKLVDRPKRGRIDKTGYSKDTIMAIVGLGVSGPTDISERHDEALAEFFRSDAALAPEADRSNTRA